MNSSTAVHQVMPIIVWLFKISMMQQNVDTALEIRRMHTSDARQAAALSGELGYPVSIAQMEQRLQQFSALNDHAVFVACANGTVIAWIDVGIVYHLQSGAFGEIGGLVVSNEYRGRGIGQELVRAAEEWIANQGVTAVVVRSRSSRERAHAFYLRQNFSLAKTSFVFTKTLTNTRS